MSPVPQEILDLVERFARSADLYRRAKYNEAQVRQEFIDPFFAALGWDVGNRRGQSPTDREVIIETSMRAGKPDYCFYAGKHAKFYVEAKKPAVDVLRGISPAHQLRSYAWSSKLPLSILTDFEEFSVYDCRIPPRATDKAATARTLYLPCDQYSDQWDKIAAIFARDAVYRGDYDRYAETIKDKRATQEVDDVFLRDLEEWRALLARNIALRNADRGLAAHQLNYAVQMILDRIIFLRICEDRQIEPTGRLEGHLEGEGIYPRLVDLFKRSNARYNSGLFHFDQERGREDPDGVTPNLKIDDNVLRDIIKGLYYPKSPYKFDVMSADILGSVYERFLGSTIRLQPSGRAKVEQKPEVRKAGGVYYTPKYIVEYIVNNTVGRLCEAKSPHEISKLRILDPACGSGSFLLGAYEYLLDYHLRWYLEHPTKPPRSEAYEGMNGQWHLTPSVKKNILTHNLYGVDIDPQAVEVTKLSLLLKLLEGETATSLATQLELIPERALPDLAANIKCGNSLIGPDFREAKQMSLLDDEEAHRINAFDWRAEFSQIMAAGGFDAVIGNPPYIFTRERFTEEERRYFSQKYRATWEKHNTYMLFMELMLRLVRRDGRGGFIVPNSWLTIESAHLLRRLLVPHLELLMDLNYTVFEHVSMEPCVFVVSGGASTPDVLAFRARSRDDFLAARPFQVNRGQWSGDSRRIVFSESLDSARVADKLAATSRTVSDLFDVRSGLQAYERGKGIPTQTASDVSKHIFDREKYEDGNSWRYLEGRDVARYRLAWSGMWMQYGPWLAQPREPGIFSRPRLLLREITSDAPYCLHTVYVEGHYLNNKSVLNVLHPEDCAQELKVLLGMLNSRLLSLYYKQRAVKSARRIFPKVVIKNLREFPYPDTVDPGIRNGMVALVERMLDLHKRLAPARTPNDKTLLHRQIHATDREIDRLVYDLYGLTAEEIAIVEGAAKRSL